jgi:hypothetical protein
MPKRWLRRAPALPPKAKPSALRLFDRRRVRWADGATRFGKRSEKVAAEQAGF